MSLRVHLVGAGGMGMVPLAIYLSRSGWAVTGEDDGLTDPAAAALEGGGVRIVAAGAVPQGTDRLVVSSAIPRSHPSCREALARGLPIARRGEMLAEILRGRKLIAIAGSHGKTTTAAMLASALQAAAFPCGYLVGGLFAEGGPAPAAVSSSDWVVAEIDESDGTIDGFSPEITLLANLDWDHPDLYRSADACFAAFTRLADRTRTAVFYFSGCSRSTALVEALEGRAHYSFGPGGEFSAEIEAESAEGILLRLGGKFPVGRAQVRAQGAFNAANAAGALAVCSWLGISPVGRLLESFPGVRRRQAVLFEGGGIRVMEDYAHHPSEIRALLEGQASGGRRVVIFQPHRHSRTAQYRSGFAEALAAADQLFLLEVYPAGEAPVPGGDSADLYRELQKRGIAATFLRGGHDGLVEKLLGEIRPGDNVLFVGAGDIDREARRFAGRLAAVREGGAGGFVGAVRTLLSAGCELREAEPLAGKTTLRVGGAARFYAEPALLEDLTLLYREASRRGIGVFLLGRGSNLVVPDEGVDGLVVRLHQPEWRRFELLPEGAIWAGAGLRLKELCGLACGAGLQGFEFLEGIPGTVGGALRMNAGAMGGWMFDVVEEVRLLTPAGEVLQIPKERLSVRYRECPEVAAAVALGARLKAPSRAQAEAIRGRMREFQEKRQHTQPREPSAGCIFKNPPGLSAGKMIDELGLKGTRIGDAEVSPVHGNFIINRGRASASDVIRLVRLVREKVREGRGVDLEPEVLLYGKDWSEVL